jgi:general secretion pathway protein A
VPLAPANPPAAELAWPAGVDPWLHEALALRALFRAWGIELEPTAMTDACERARTHAMQCLSGTADLAQLARMDLPAVVEIRPPSGPPFLAALLGLTEREARLAVAGEPRTVPAAVFAGAWSGAHVTLWRGSAPAHSLSLGDRGDGVEWLHRQLARARGAADTGAVAALYSEATVREVLAFQRAQGLAQDGIAGPLTLARLADLDRNGSPSLRRTGAP